MEDLLVVVIALWFSVVIMWVWCFYLQKKIEKLELLNKDSGEVKE